MPSRVGVSARMITARMITALMITALMSAAMPATAVAQDGPSVPRWHDGPTALSPRPGAADTTVPGEGLAEDEIDARVGWLLQTYIAAVRAALRRDNPQRTQDEMARTRAALNSLEQRLATGAHRLMLPAGLPASIAAAADALARGDVGAVDRALADGERGLRAALAKLDAELSAKPGASR